MISDEAPAMLNRLKALSLLAPDALILTPVADSDVLVAHKNGTDMWRTCHHERECSKAGRFDAGREKLADYVGWI